MRDKKKNGVYKCYCNFLSLILTLNNFAFNCTHHLQIMGCAMGTSKVSNFTLNFHQEKLHFLPQCCTEKKITTAKQLSIADLQMIKRSYILHQ